MYNADIQLKLKLLISLTVPEDVVLCQKLLLDNNLFLS